MISTEVIKDARMNNLSDFLEIRSKTAKTELNKQLSIWKTENYLKQSSKKYRDLKKIFLEKPQLKEKLQHLFDKLATKEDKFDPFINKKSELEKESYSQLFFTNTHFKLFNEIPYFLTFWWFLRIYAFPTFAVLIPIIAIIGPYIFIKYIMKVNMPIEEYYKLFIKLYVGQFEINSGIDKIKVIGQSILFLISIVQSIWQPINNAIHLNKIKLTILDNINDIQEYLNLYDELRKLWVIPRNIIPDAVRKDNSMLAAFCFENPTLLQLLIRGAATAEVTFRIAVNPKITAVDWSPTKQLIIENTCDIDIQHSKQKLFTVNLNTDSHSLLTGPNRGGKSTVLRAVLRSVILAHTYGVIIGDNCNLSYIDWIKSNLRIEDLPGSESLFEREVSFASNTLNIKGSGLVLIDELFHSTNPNDSIKASNIYLKKLWSRNNIFSIISTHIFELVQESPDNIKKLCCPAEELDDGSIVYKYGISDGICKISSVNDILKEKCLFGESA
jgi:hypothetical protein